jgi:hypothetical protein
MFVVKIIKQPQYYSITVLLLKDALPIIQNYNTSKAIFNLITRKRSSKNTYCQLCPYQHKY